MSAAGFPSCDTASVIAWLADGARSAPTAQEVLTQLCDRLTDCGVPLWRVAVFVRTLHPQVMARRFLWRPGEAASVAEADFERAATDEFRLSPITQVRSTAVSVRRRLADPLCPNDFPVLDELRQEGVTDYLAAPLVFTDGEIHAASFTTRQEGGFSETQLAGLQAVIAPLARVAEVRALRRIAVNLLDAYVGHSAGERILAGHIRRGDSETIRAVIWLSDMRGFTGLADSVPPQTLIALLNRFFDCLVPPVIEEGGEVLKFMGDGLLAIFPIGEGLQAGEVCGRALAAAKRARAELLAMRADEIGGERIRFGLALHVGDTLYGNIGAGARLDFTCIGPAVNKAARLEKLAAQLGRMIIASHELACHLPGEFAPLGAFELRGFRSAETAYGLLDEAG